MKNPIRTQRNDHHVHRELFSRNALGLACLIALIATSLLSTFTASAFVLDDFNGASLSGWTSTLNSGSVVQSGGQLTISTVPFHNALTYSKKTDHTFTPTTGHTLEFKVQVNSILNNGAETNGAAVLGWVPTGGALGVNGYAVGVSTGSVAIIANSSFVFVTNLTAGAYSLPASNTFVTLKLTPDGANMVVKASVYNTADGRFNLLFERTITNSATPLIGTGGNAVLGTFNDASSGSATVSFDNLQDFDTVRQVIDDFSGPYPAGWQDHVSGIATNFNNGSGQLETDAGIGNNQVSGTFKADKTFTITDGVRVEFRVDVVNVAGDVNNFTILDYGPTGDNDFAALGSYHLAFSAAQFYVGKGFGNWWDQAYTLPAPQSNVRLIQTMTGEGNSVRIESRLEDLSKDVNDPARVFYQITHVDSTSSPYTNKNGYFQLGNYHSGGVQSIITWDNAEANVTLSGNAPPVITGVSPVDGKNFYDATGGVSFNVADDVSAPINNIKLTLNGVTYTNGSPGVTITPPDASSLSRHFVLTGLAPNTFYSGQIQASDNLGATITLHYEFDTFLSSDLQIESEDFNYSDNPGTDGGKFIDGGVWAYLNKQGTQDIDYHDSRTSGNSDDPAAYRNADYPRTYPTSDGPRAIYTGGNVELLTYDNENGDWRNYTRTFTAGTFNVFSRQSTFALPIGLVTLERVTSDPTVGNQTSYVLGSFQQLGDSAGDTGFDSHRNVPLTDASGNRLVLRMASGVDTLRVRDVYVNDRNNADVFHNYLVFVPVADPGTLRPVVSMTSPQAGTTSRISNQSEETFAEIANRDTTVDTNTITMMINGSPAAITITNTTGGARVYWSFANLPTAPSFTHTLSFNDSDGSNIVKTWTYSYPFLRASNSLPLNALSVRGFHVRTVQADNGGVNLGNLLLRAEQQLSVPPQIPADISYEGDMNDTLIWSNDSATPKDVPGLSGVPGSPVPLNNIASEALGYIEFLTAGPHRFYASSDDGFQLRSGTGPKDVNAVVMGQQDGSTFGGTFDFVVEAPGLYPIRNLWYENGGGANFNLSSVNLSDNSHIAINDTNDPPNVIKVYNSVYTVGLLSSTTVGGTYNPEPSAVVDTSLRTVTIPTSGSIRFYKLTTVSGAQLKIDSIVITGGNVVLHYKFQ